MTRLKLKEFRELNKLSQRDISSLLGIHQAQYWRWEVGKSYPNAKQLLELAKILGCTPNDLYESL